MELRQLEYVVAVAELQNFTRAAQRCHVAQSALSHQVARLEKELGVRLFDRTSRSVSITAAGAAMLPAARQALASVDRVRADVEGRVRGTLRIGAIPTVTAVDLPAVIASYRGSHPEVDVTLAAAASDDLVSAVRSHELDIGFIGVPTGFATSGVEELELMTEELVAAVRSGHWLLGADAPALGDLADEDFVDFPVGTAARRQTDEAFRRAGVRRTVLFEVGSVEFVLDFVARGLAVGLIPAGYRMRASGIELVRLADPPIREQRVVTSTRPSAATLAFLAELRISPRPMPAACPPTTC